MFYWFGKKSAYKNWREITRGYNTSEDMGHENECVA
jgi:hypothetical protein